MSEKAIEIGGDHVKGISLPIISVAPISVPVEGRGAALPILLLSQCNSQSLYACGPLTNHWAAQGFVVIQPTRLASRMFGLAQDDPRRQQLWRHRENDLIHVLDALTSLLAAVPALSGRVDRDLMAVAGHSWGAQTASMLLGAMHPDADDGSGADIRDECVKAGVLLTIPSTGGSNLSPFAAKRFHFMHPAFSGMAAPALIIASDADRGTMTVRGPEWWREAYDRSPAPRRCSRCMAASIRCVAFRTTRHARQRMSGHGASRPSSPSRPHSCGSMFRPDDGSWQSAVAELASGTPEGHVETRWT